MPKPVSFYSEGTKLAGDVYLPEDIKPGERRAGIVLCHGYTGVRNIYLPDNARVLAEAGYVVLNFDYKGWGDSEGPKTRLAPYSRVADVQAALSFLSAHPQIDRERLGIYGTSYGGATVVFVAAIDPRVKCVVSVVGIGNGPRWMRSVRRPDEYHDLLARADEDRRNRALTGASALADRNEILLPDRQSAELGAAARKNNPFAVTQVPLEFIDDTSASIRNGWSTALRRGRSCSSQRTTIGWCRPRRARRCTHARASPRSSSCSRASATTRSTAANRSTK
jgi:uncharacterized protein